MTGATIVGVFVGAFVGGAFAALLGYVSGYVSGRIDGYRAGNFDACKRQWLEAIDRTPLVEAKSPACSVPGCAPQNFLHSVVPPNSQN